MDSLLRNRVAKKTAALGLATIATLRRRISATPRPVEPKAFPFMKLPAEIRLQIYEVYFGCELYPLYLREDRPRPTKRLSKKTKGKKTGDAEGMLKKTLIQLFAANDGVSKNLLLVCRQIYAEAIPVLYGIQVFSFYDVPAFSSFVDKIKGHRDEIRHLALPFIWQEDEGEAEKFRATLSMFVTAERLQKILVFIPYHLVIDHGIALARYWASLLLPFLKAMAARIGEEAAVDMLCIGEWDFEHYNRFWTNAWIGNGSGWSLSREIKQFRTEFRDEMLDLMKTQ